MIETIYSDDDCSILLGDCLEYLRSLPDKCVDLVKTSPPYEDARTYSMGFKLKGEDWVRWAVEIFMECYRVCRGLVCWTVEGKTRDYQWSATPALLMADLHRRGVKLRKPLIFHRVGIPGSGGPDWMRGDTEFMVCATHGRLPWSDNTACGHPPKWAPGGEMSNRLGNGARVNGRDAWGGTPTSSSGEGRNPDGSYKTRNKKHTKRMASGAMRSQSYDVPKLANPGNVIWTDDGLGDLTKQIVGGGVMGSDLCHENEAPYPEALVERVIKPFCPVGGVVLDPFGGSGTTLAIALKLGRKCISIDVRRSQTDLMVRRLAEVRTEIANQETVKCQETPTPP